MSRIFDAIKNAQEQRSKNALAVGDALGVMELSEPKYARQYDFDVALTVYGHAVGEFPFYQQAKAIRGNADGGLVLLVVPVVKGQDLLLINDRASNKSKSVEL